MPRRALRPSSEDDFVVEFPDLVANHGEDLAADDSQAIVFARPAAAPRIGFAPQPTQALHSLEQGVQGAGAELIAMPPQLCEDPLSVHRFLPGMVQNVNLPEAQQDLAVDGLHRCMIELRGTISLIVILPRPRVNRSIH
jgi:hypothetical protein